MGWFRSDRIRTSRGSYRRRRRWPLLVFAIGVAVLIWAGWSAATATAAAGALSTPCRVTPEADVPVSA